LWGNDNFSAITHVNVVHDAFACNCSRALCRSLAIFLTYGHARHAGKAGNSSPRIYYSDALFCKKNNGSGKNAFSLTTPRKCNQRECGLVARCILIKKRPEVFQILTPQSDAYYFNTSLALGVVFFSNHLRIAYIWRAELTHRQRRRRSRNTQKIYFIVHESSNAFCSFEFQFAFSLSDVERTKQGCDKNGSKYLCEV
jgi:hypothetical protein